MEELAKVIIGIIRAGSGVRATYCFIQMSKDDEEVNVYKKRIKNIAVFYVVAESIWQIKDILFYYFGAGGGAGGGGAGGF